VLDYSCSTAYKNVMTVPHKMDGLETMLDYRGVGFTEVRCEHECGVFACIVRVDSYVQINT
jgi:hypothetical protein